MLKASRAITSFKRYLCSCYGETRWRYSSSLSCKHPENPQGVIREETETLLCKVSSVLSGIGFAPSQQSYICSPRHLSKHLAFFKRLDIHADDFCKIISAYPQALILDPDMDLEVSIAQLDAALGRSLLTECILAWPSLLGLGFPHESAQESNLTLPNVGFVQHESGVSREGLGLEFAKEDARLGSSSKEGGIDSRSSNGGPGSAMQRLRIHQKEFSSKVDFLLKCGFKRNTKLLAKVLYCALHKSKQDIDAVVGALTGLGLARNHAGRLIKLQPTILQQRPAEIAPKLDFIFNTLSFSIEDLFKYSSFMLYDLDTHIRPRYLMHAWIKSKRLLRRNFKLDYIMSMSEKQFLGKFVECHEGGVSMYNKFVGKAK